MAGGRRQGAAALEHALADERLRNTRVINAVRFQGVSAFLALSMLL